MTNLNYIIDLLYKSQIKKIPYHQCPAFFLILTILCTNNFSQSDNFKKYQFISPLPGSELVLPNSKIIIRHGNILDEARLKNNLFSVSGKRSGIIKGKVILAEDRQTILFYPDKSFMPEEEVIIRFKGGLISESGESLPPLNFSFFTTSCRSSNSIINEKRILDHCFISPAKSGNQDKEYGGTADTLITGDIPDVYVSVSDNPTEGYVFIAPWFFQGSFFDPNYLLIVDNYGTPVYYKKNEVLALDFKLHTTGKMTYFDQGKDAFIAMDSSFNVIDTFRCGNGYPTDFHDIQLLSNGNYLLMGQDFQIVRMDTIVPGGDTTAIVIGQIIQEKDKNHNVIFQWRSWDHFAITDASDKIDLTAHTIDYVHANSIELDLDGNIIISCRNMEEVTKIDRLTGEIIWRMGGKKNQFQFYNNPRGFSFQHDARRIFNRNLTIFDNGNYLIPRYTSILEYNIDEVHKIISMDWSYSFNNHFSAAMGNAQRLENGRTFIGWGSSWDPAATEVKYDGTKTFEIRFDSLFYSYRAFRFPWRTNLITSDTYSVDFEYVPVNLSDTREILITNNSNEQIEISSYYSRRSLFSVTNKIPLAMEPFENKTIQIQFSPDSVGVFSDDIHLRIIKENEMIAQVIKVFGSSDPNADVEEKESSSFEFELSQNYPNPFNPATKIKFTIPSVGTSFMKFVQLKVYDVLGNEVATLVNEEKAPGEYEVEFSAGQESFPVLNSGVYFYQFRAGDFTQTRKMLLVK